jgi:hypothetical protein
MGKRNSLSFLSVCLQKPDFLFSPFTFFPFPYTYAIPLNRYQF